jgi:hypothetical protein
LASLLEGGGASGAVALVGKINILKSNKSNFWAQEIVNY